MNADNAYIGVKQGFPYKYHNIKSLAISNGMLIRSGNTHNLPNLTDWEAIFASDLSASSVDYDTQPGSTLGLDNSFEYPGYVGGTIVTNPLYYALPYLPEFLNIFRGFYAIKLQICDIDPPNYDPVFIPLKSSLCLKTTSDDGTEIDNQFSITNFSDIVIPQGEDTSGYLARYSSFDDCAVQPNTRYQHEYVSDTSINRLSSWLSDPELNAVGHVTGTVSGPDAEGSLVQLKVGNTAISSSTVNSDGTFSLPYTLLGTNNATLLITKNNHYPIKKDLSITAVSTSLQYNAISVQTNIINSSSVFVYSNPTSNFFHTIQEAIDYAFNNQLPNTTIRVLAGTYAPFSIAGYCVTDQSGSLQAANLSINGVGAGSVIVDGTGTYSPGIDIYGNYNLKLTISDLTVTNCTRSGVAIDQAEHNQVSEGCQYLLSGLHITANYSTEIRNACDENDRSGGGIHCNHPATIVDCVIYDNHVCHQNGSVLTGWGYGGGIYVRNLSEGTTTVKNCRIFGNTAFDGGGIYCTSFIDNGDDEITGTGAIVLDGDSLSTNNCAERYYQNSYQSGDNEGLYAYKCSQLTIKNSLFYHHQKRHGLYVVYLEGCPNSNFVNNTVADNYDFAAVGTPPVSTYLNGIKLQGCNPIMMANNIFLKNNRPIISSGSAPVVKYNCWYNNLSTNQFTYPPYTTDATNYSIDPMLSAYNSFVPYQPIWNASTRSLMIDTGDPTPNGIGWWKDEGDHDLMAAGAI